jgi:hypothetical protein
LSDDVPGCQVIRKVEAWAWEDTDEMEAHVLEALKEESSVEEDDADDRLPVPEGADEWD